MNILSLYRFFKSTISPCSACSLPSLFLILHPSLFHISNTFLVADIIFQILYKELYYRHIYAKLQPTTEQRLESWQNYLDLFDYLLSM